MVSQVSARGDRGAAWDLPLLLLTTLSSRLSALPLSLQQKLGAPSQVELFRMLVAMDGAAGQWSAFEAAAGPGIMHMLREVCTGMPADIKHSRPLKRAVYQKAVFVCHNLPLSGVCDNLCKNMLRLRTEFDYWLC